MSAAAEEDQRLDQVFGALSDRTRRAILFRVVEGGGGATAGELAAPFAISAPAVSRHLKVLEGAGVLERRREGREHRFFLVPEPIGEVETVLSRLRTYWDQRFDALEKLLGEEGDASPEAD